MLYTKKGDDGKSELFGNEKRISKYSVVLEALGALDELNSWIGFIKSKSALETKEISKKSFYDILHAFQESLFIIQAEIGGADKHIQEEDIERIEEIFRVLEIELPAITSFVIPGTTELSALYDIARTKARKAEREVIRAQEIEHILVSQETIKFLNRSSSLLYACARYKAYQEKKNEEKPHY